MILETHLFAIFTILFCFWILATILVPINSAVELELFPNKLLFITQYVPNWNFFAPHPGEWDYHLMHRGVSTDQAVTGWNEVTEANRTKHRFKWLWNPQMHRMKALFDFSQALTVSVPNEDAPQVQSDSSLLEANENQDLKKFDSEKVVLSLRYLYILNHITSIIDTNSFEKVQFMIIRHNPQTDVTDPIFVSEFHEC